MSLTTIYQLEQINSKYSLAPSVAFFKTLTVDVLKAKQPELNF